MLKGGKMKTLKQERPNVYNAFMSLSQAIDTNNSLSEKFKELIKLASCVTQGSSYGVGFHVRKAQEYSATKDEIIDTIIYCLPIIGIPLTNQALETAMGTMEMIQIELQKKNK
jgi:AhpD family alkylhydroperoxidase